MTGVAVTLTSVALPRPRVSPETGLIPCRHEDPELWFSESPARLEIAKELCRRCPLRTECLAGAVARAEPWGVWGGEIFADGVVIPRKRGRGRPPKNQAAA